MNKPLIILSFTLHKWTWNCIDSYRTRTVPLSFMFRSTSATSIKIWWLCGYPQWAHYPPLEINWISVLHYSKFQNLLSNKLPVTFLNTSENSLHWKFYILRLSWVTQTIPNIEMRRLNIENEPGLIGRICRVNRDKKFNSVMLRITEDNERERPCRVWLDDTEVRVKQST